MSPLDDLPPDLRATLSLLVDRGKSYAEVADLLGIPERAVRERAHAALDALAGEHLETAAPAPVGVADGDEPSGRARVGGADGDEPASGANAGFASGDGGSFGHDGARLAGAPGSRTSSGAGRNGVARSPGAVARSGGGPVSRRGGAIVLALIAAVVIVVVAGGGSSSPKSGATGGSRSASAQQTGGKTGTTSGKGPQVSNQITLTPPEPGSKAIGLVEVLTEGGQHAFYIAAEHLPPSKGFTYVIWLYNSPTSAEAISKSPNVGSNGRLQGGALLPSNASRFHQIIVTRETSERPTSPGPMVLSGTFSLGK
jgi:Sigma-70, region 4